MHLVTESVSINHIDDLCRAQVFLAENKASSGRYICNSHDTTVVQLARLFADKYPQYNVKSQRYIYESYLSSSSTQAQTWTFFFL
jgi:anthocyanidin reductase